MRNLLEGVQLDSYQCFLPWGSPRPRVEALLRERAVPVEVRETERLLLRSRMLGAPLLCDVGLGFRDGCPKWASRPARALRRPNGRFLRCRPVWRACWGSAAKRP